MSTTSSIRGAIDAIYSAAAVSEQWPAALDAIAMCFDAVGTALLLRKSDGAISTIVSPALTKAARDYEAWGWKLDFALPRALSAIAANHCGCFTDRHIASRQEIETHPFYTEFRSRHGLGPFLGTQLMPDANVMAVLTVQGAARRATFYDQEIEVFAELARHAERALMLTTRLLEAEARSEALLDALSMLSCGVFGLDADGGIIFINPTAERMLGPVLQLEHGRLTAVGSYRTSLANSLRNVQERERAKGPFQAYSPLMLPEPDGDHSLVLYFLPVGRELQLVLRETFTNSRLIVLAIAQSGDRVDPALIRDLLGLTNSEARLASFIGQGKSPREAAKELGITEETARTVLKRIFIKTNTSRQSQLVAKLARLTLKST